MKHNINVDGVDVSSTGTAHIGFIQNHKFETNGVEAISVVAEQETNADANFNIELGGNDLFASEASVASGGVPEEFVPDQNKHAAGSTLEAALAVSSAGSAGDTMNVSLLVDDQRD